jgi:hypothetical protein
MEPPVGDLVDAALPLLCRVALTDGEQDKRGLLSLAVNVENRAPLTFGLARSQGAYSDPALRQLLNRRRDCRSRSVGRMGQILGEDLLVNPQRKAKAPRR